MINLLTNDYKYICFMGIILGFIMTFILLKKCMHLLPTDQGRAYAVQGQLSKGKPRGAGVIFISVFCLVGLLFGKFSIENICYLIIVFLGMLTGYLDDAASVSWGELKKGLLDFCIAILSAGVYIGFNYSDGIKISSLLLSKTFVVNPIIMAIFIVVLVWASINVTNCTDGVDSLSGSLTIVTLMSFAVLYKLNDKDVFFIYLFIACLLAYTWFNATPSILMMGDAGSRAMGIIIALVALNSGYLFMYIPLAIMIILDGGLGLFKVTVRRLYKKIMHVEQCNFMGFVTTPLHDQARKVNGMSNAQCVFRFVIVQIAINYVVISLLLL